MRAAGDLEGGEGLNILRTVGMAFALYSRIPMPRLDWESESRKYTLYAFPLVGIAVGIFELLWLWMSQVLDLHTILTGAVLAALPIWVTGGIHLDGFCDVCDARASHQSRERKLEILKDSNVGAFAVIHCVLLLLVTFGLWCQLEPADFEVWGALVLLPVFSRCLSAFGALSLPNARESGMLASVTGGEQRRPGRWGLLLGSLLCAAALAALEPWFLLAAGAGYLSFLYYVRTAKREFGGTTGDLSGWFLQLCELSSLAGLVLAQRLEVLL